MSNDPTAVFRNATGTSCLIASATSALIDELQEERREHELRDWWKKEHALFQEAYLYAALNLMEHSGWLRRTIYVGQHRVVTIVASGPQERFIIPRVKSSDYVVLDSRACIRVDDSECIIDTPAATEALAIHLDTIAALFVRCATRVTIGDLLRNCRHVAPMKIAVALLVRYGVLTVSRSSRGSSGKPWPFYSWVAYRSGKPLGHVIPSAERSSKGSLTVHSPGAVALDATLAKDAFTESVYARRSIRAFCPEGVVCSELGQLLLLSFADRRVGWGRKRKAKVRGTRPYASAGGIYELRLYLVVVRCKGVASGAYRYDPIEHILCPLPCRESSIARLKASACSAMGTESEPAVYLLVAAQFESMCEKYGQYAYSLILKNVGCLMQSIYMAAAYGGVGCCAIGFLDTGGIMCDWGLDGTSVGIVGEMVLGRIPLDGALSGRIGQGRE